MAESEAGSRSPQTPQTPAAASTSATDAVAAPVKAAKKTLARYGIDAEDLKGAKRAIVELETLHRTDPTEIAEVTGAWGTFLDGMHTAFSEKITNIAASLRAPEMTARSVATQLTQLAKHGVAYTQAVPDVFVLDEAQSESILSFCYDIMLSSPSGFMRSLALQAIQDFLPCATFLRTFWDSKGEWFVGKALDDEGAKDQAIARTFITKLAELGKSKLQQLDEKAVEQGAKTVEKTLLQNRNNPELSHKNRSNNNSFLGGAFADTTPDRQRNSLREQHPHLRMPTCLMLRLVSCLDPLEPMSIRYPRTVVFWAAERLCEVLYYCPEAVTAADGVRHLLQFAVDTNNKKYLKIIIPAVARAYEDPSTRSLLHHTDIGVLFAPFNEGQVADSKRHLLLMKNAATVLVHLMRSWAGLFWVATDPIGLRSLVDLLHLPGPVVRKMVLLHFFNSLLVALAPHRGLSDSSAASPWVGVEADEERELKRELKSNMPEAGSVDGDGFDLMQDDFSPAGQNTSFSAGRTSFAAGGDSSPGADQAINDTMTTNTAVGHHVLDPFLGVALLILEQAGLPKALMSVVRESSKDGAENAGLLPQGAAQLLQQVLVLMDTGLPEENVRELHKYFNEVIAKLADRKDGFVCSMTTRLFQDVLTKQSTGSGSGMGISGGSVGPLQRPALTMDDHTFQLQLKESHVEGAFDRWNFELIRLLIHGPLRQTAKLKSTKERTQFFPKLLLFYRPGRGGFANMKESDPNRITAGQVGVSLIELLGSSKEGADILNLSEMVKDINSMIMEAAESKNFSQQPEYLVFLERMTSTPHGLAELAKHNVYTNLINLFQDQRSCAGMSPVLHQLLQHIHFGAVPNHGICQEGRRVLTLALASESNPVRLSAVTQLKRAMWRDLSLMLEWGMERLMERLADSFDTIVESCFNMLATICATSDEALDFLIKSKPDQLLSKAFLKVAKSGDFDLSRLMYRIVGTDAGYAFLNERGWVEAELAAWEEHHMSYIDNVDLQISKYVIGGPQPPRRTSVVHTRSASDPDVVRRRTRSPKPANAAAEDASLDVLPLHFIGELCRTEDGRAFFEQSSLFTHLVTVILNCTSIQNDGMSPLTPKDGAMVGGFDFSFASVDQGSFAVPRPSSLTPRQDHIRTPEPEQEFLPQELLAPGAQLAPKAPTPIAKKKGGGDEVLLSASRVQPSRAAGSMEVTCSPQHIRSLRAALIAIANMGTSDSAFKVLYRHHQPLLSRMILLAKCCSHALAKGTAFVALTLLARGREGSDFLQQLGFSVFSVPNAYVSGDGVPYSVSFCHPAGDSTWLGFRAGSSLRFASQVLLDEAKPKSDRVAQPQAYPLEYPLFEIPNFCVVGAPKNLPEEFTATLALLSNSLTAAKPKSLKLLKSCNVGYFQVQEVMWYLMWLSSVFRFKCDARKVIADCLQQRVPLEDGSRATSS